ncbi:MAG: helix-turn-helix transcriptional regulator [Spirochaetia bacterium]|jgi:DNA-binding CsgD family transcriptional regulator|nr:helix-turn-helix transcriptional regulator [Spirochaetia bacterium]
MEGIRLIINDLLLFASTALVLSITCLCILLQVKAKDKYSKGLLTILVPLSLQMGINSFIAYAVRVLPLNLLNGTNFGMFALVITLSSILLTTYLFFSLSHYLVQLLPVEEGEKKLGARIINIITLIFFMGSLYFIIAASKGNWNYGMKITLDYHFSSGSFIYFIHGLVTLFYMKKAKGREEESLLKGIAMTFIPMLVLFPLDMIFFRHSSFKLSYICFSVFTVNTYYFISRYYFRVYEPVPESLDIKSNFFSVTNLTEREEEVSRLLIKGRTNSEIGAELFISVNTVKSHIKNIYKKLEVSNRVQLIHFIQKGDDSNGGSD